MAKKLSVTKDLERAQKEFARKLAETRKQIRKLSRLGPCEYTLLHEDDVAVAKKAAATIDLFLGKLGSTESRTLVLMRERSDSDKLLLAVMRSRGIELLPDGCGLLRCEAYIFWEDGRPGLLQNMQVNLDQKVRVATPLHRVLATPGSYLVCGETEVADKLLPAKKREGGPHDRFNFFYKLTRDLGYELTDKKLKARVEEERERVTHDCVRHVKSLEGVCEEMFFRGASAPYHNFKGDASSHLVSRAKGLAEQMRDTMSECRLYGVETDASREIAAFGKRWIKLFNLGNDDDT